MAMSDLINEFLSSEAGQELMNLGAQKAEDKIQEFYNTQMENLSAICEQLAFGTSAVFERIELYFFNAKNKKMLKDTDLLIYIVGFIIHILERDMESMKEDIDLSTEGDEDLREYLLEMCVSFDLALEFVDFMGIHTRTDNHIINDFDHVLAEYAMAVRTDLTVENCKMYAQELRNDLDLIGSYSERKIRKSIEDTLTMIQIMLDEATKVFSEFSDNPQSIFGDD